MENKEEYMELVNKIANTERPTDYNLIMGGKKYMEAVENALKARAEESDIKYKEEPEIVIPEVNSNTNLEDFKKEVLINNGLMPFNRQQRRLIEKNKKKYAKKLLSQHKDGLEVISKMIDEVGEEETTKYLIERLTALKELNKENGNKD